MEPRRAWTVRVRNRPELWTLWRRVDAAGVSPFEQWFERLLNDVAAARGHDIAGAAQRQQLVERKGVGGGVFEITLDFGPGYVPGPSGRSPAPVWTPT